MSLRGRLALATALACLAALLIGSVLAGLHVRARLAEAMAADRELARGSVARMLAELPAAANPRQELEALVRLFDGATNVRLSLIDGSGTEQARSYLAAPRAAVPGWFEALVAPEPDASRISLAGYAAPIAAVGVRVEPRSELAEVWAAMRLGLTILGLVAGLALGFGWITIALSLRPLDRLALALGRVGAGDYTLRLPRTGPPEIAGLAGRYNQMAERLAAMAQENRRLSEQILRLQDEERAELARDLHDDIGPLLFAIDVDASAIARAVPADERVHGRAEAIRGAAGQARTAVRRILDHLRPGLAPSLGLTAALRHLAEDLASRHPDVLISTAFEEGAWPAVVEAAIYRAVREAAVNALRHGHPTRLALSVGADAHAIRFTVADDGGGWRGLQAEPGFGLLGMRERLAALGGALELAETVQPPGLVVSGSVPFSAETEATAAASVRADDGAKSLDRTAA
ncbi:histidine kinase [Aurantimonas sp. MSK8Z-1]|uniref:sensor histidine kinase n=1 Tax=Mangrovibrevibacter kandeliae TaxID=2968473 RepID=UPI0021185C82|nr:histidine kinase [Aurantimonas sp. MSK8Z-1]MCW4115601.1 histidine kinase [Aurantimonas sp. MSK8Z-1]